MASKQGTDIRALDDIDDPEQYASGVENVALARARALLEPPNVGEMIGDPLENDTLNLRAWLGRRPSQSDMFSLEERVDDVLRNDDRIDELVSEVEFTERAISVAFEVTANDETVSYVLELDEVNGATLIPEGE